jgi:hypothetical protein
LGRISQIVENHEEETRMKPSIITLWLVSAVAGAHLSFAQPAPERPPAQNRSPEALVVSDAELETFATIYVDLLATVAKYKGEIQSAKTEEEAAKIQGRMEDESIEKVEKRGWTPEKFNDVTAAINMDPDLADKAVKLIEQKS